MGKWQLVRYGNHHGNRGGIIFKEKHWDATREDFDPGNELAGESTDKSWRIGKVQGHSQKESLNKEETSMPKKG